MPLALGDAGGMRHSAMFLAWQAASKRPLNSLPLSTWTLLISNGALAKRPCRKLAALPLLALLYNSACNHLVVGSYAVNWNLGLPSSDPSWSVSICSS